MEFKKTNNLIYIAFAIHITITLINGNEGGYYKDIAREGIHKNDKLITLFVKDNEGKEKNKG